MARIMNDIITVPTGDTETKDTAEPSGKQYANLVVNC